MESIVKKGLASIIVVNFNGMHLLEECLDSLLDQSYKEIEIIVVDNGSQDGSCEFIEKRYSDKVKLMKNKTNLGCTGGSNIGICASKGEFIVLVNNDTRSDKEMVGHLIEAGKADEKIGMCATKLLNYFEPNVIDAAGMVIYKDGLNQGRGRYEIDRGQYESIEEVIYATDGGCLYKRKMLDEIGFFDEDFFAYGDDTELGLRSRLLGWKALYMPKAIVYHKISQTAGQYSIFKLFLVERNRIFIIIKYYPLLFLLRSFFYTALRYWFQFLSILQNRGASKRFVRKASIMIVIKTLIHAYLSALVNIPKLLKKRFVIRKKKKINDREFVDLFNKFGISAKELVYRD